MKNNTYYVYCHTHPITKEVVYVGKGSRGRAWHCAESNSRSQDHAKWMTELLNSGFTPDKWVELLETNLYEDEAFNLEQKYINSTFPWPKFNSKFNQACVLTPELVEDMKYLRKKENLSYAKLSEKYSVFTMTIYRAINGQTKNYL